MTEPPRRPGPGVRAVFLHVGTMKTGTTYLQSRLKEHRGALQRDGVLAPAGQLTALRDLFGRRGTLGHRRVTGSWAQLIETLQTSSCARGVVSMEYLSTCAPQEISDILAQFAPADVHVIVTVRELPRVMAAQWQETIQNRATWTWDDYSAEIVAHLDSGVSPSAAADASAAEHGPADAYGPGAGNAPDQDADDATTDRKTVRRTAAGRFWRQHDIARIVRDWSAAAGADRVHLVTVPPTGQAPDVLWERFTEVIGVDSDRYPRPDEAVRSNVGLDLAASEFLRRLNVRLDPAISRAAYLRHVKHLLGKTALVGRDVALKPTLSPEQHARVLRHSQQLVAHLRDLGVEVVGDLTDLVPDSFPAPAPESSSLERKVAEASIDAVLAVLRHLDDLEPTIAAAARSERGTSAAGDGERRAQRRRDRRAGRDGSTTPRPDPDPDASAP